MELSPADETAGINEKLLITKPRTSRTRKSTSRTSGISTRIRTKDSRYETEFKDGRVFDESTTVLRKQDEYIGRIWFYHDITQIRQATETLTESSKD